MLSHHTNSHNRYGDFTNILDCPIESIPSNSIIWISYQHFRGRRHRAQSHNT